MSGLELLVVDGGTTAVSIATAAFGALGYKQRRRDTQELVDPQEIEILLKDLREAHARLAFSHKDLTAAWRGPLSLFGARDVSEAVSHKVPAWAIQCAKKGRDLVEQAAALGDLADVYEVQLCIAVRQGRKGKGLVRDPPSTLLSRLGELSQRIEFVIPYVVEARAAFDSPAEAVPDTDPDNTDVGMPKHNAEVPAPSKSLAHEDANQLPITILRDRGPLGELWRRQSETLGRIFASRSNNDSELEAFLPQDVKSKLSQIRSDDPYTAMAAAVSLGRLGDRRAEVQQADAEFRNTVRKAITAALCGVLIGRHAVAHESVRKAALEALEKVQHQAAEPTLSAVVHNCEESTACRNLAQKVLNDLAANAVPEQC